MPPLFAVAGDVAVIFQSASLAQPAHLASARAYLVVE